MRKLRLNVRMCKHVHDAKKYRGLVRILRVVKVQFGSMNFIEKMTPIVFQNFATGKLVKCLLVTNSYYAKRS